jgi:hypothetical protein
VETGAKEMCAAPLERGSPSRRPRHRLREGIAGLYYVGTDAVSLDLREIGAFVDFDAKARDNEIMVRLGENVWLSVLDVDVAAQAGA